MDMLELLKSQLSGPVVEKLGGLLGLDAAQAQQVGSAILPAQVTALTQKASTAAGAQQLLDLAAQVPHGTPLDLIANPGSLDQVRQSGTALLPQLMGNGLEDSVQHLATQTGTSRGSIQGMMQMMLPMVLGVVGGQASKLGLNASSLSGLFSGGLGGLGNLGGLGDAAAGLGAAGVAGVAGLGAAASAGLGNVMGGVTGNLGDAASGIGGAAAGLGAGLGAAAGAGLGAVSSGLGNVGAGLGNAAGKLGESVAGGVAGLGASASGVGASLGKGAAGVTVGVAGAAAGLGAAGLGAAGLGAAGLGAANKGLATVGEGAGLSGGTVHTNPALGGSKGLGWLWLLPLLLLLGLLGWFLLRGQPATTEAVPTTTEAGVTPPPPDPATATPATPAGTGTFTLAMPAAGASLPAGAFDMSGTGKPGDVLEIFEDGVSLGKVTVGEGGNWTLNVPSPKAGAHAYSVKRPDGTELGTVSTTVAAAAATGVACDKAFSLSIKDGEAVAQPFRFGGLGKGKSYTVTVMRGAKKIGTKELPLDGTCGYSYTSKPGPGTITYMVSETGMADVAGKITLDVK